MSTQKPKENDEAKGKPKGYTADELVEKNDDRVYLQGLDGKFYAADELNSEKKMQKFLVAAIFMAVLALVLALFAALKVGSMNDLSRGDVSKIVSSNAAVVQASSDAKSAKEFAMKAGEDGKVLSSRLEEFGKTSTATATAVATVLQQCKESPPTKKASSVAKSSSLTKARNEASSSSFASSSTATNRQERREVQPYVGKFWGWWNYESSQEHPMPCLADREIRGKPARCSSVSIFPRQGNETEDAWTTRAAASQGVVGTNHHIGKIQ